MRGINSRFGLATVLLAFIPLACISCFLAIEFREQQNRQEISLRTKALGGEYFEFGSLKSVMLQNTATDDDSLKPILLSCKAIHKLNLTNTKVAGSAFGMTSAARVRNLYCGGTDVNDSGVFFISRLPMLNHLDLSNTKVTDKGVEHLAKYARTLESLILDGNVGVTDDCLEHILSVGSLRHLSVVNTSMSEGTINANKKHGQVQFRMNSNELE